MENQGVGRRIINECIAIFEVVKSCVGVQPIKGSLDENKESEVERAK